MPWPPLTRPRHYTRPVMLAVLAVFATAYGALYIVADFVHPAGDGETDASETFRLAKIAGDIIPLSLYGGVWMAVGVSCLTGLWSWRVFRAAYSALTAVLATWGVLYIVLWVDTPTTVGFLGSAMWWCVFAGCVRAITLDEVTAVKMSEEAVDAARCAMRGCISDNE